VAGRDLDARYVGYVRRQQALLQRRRELGEPLTGGDALPGRRAFRRHITEVPGAAQVLAVIIGQPGAVAVEHPAVAQ